VARDDRGHIREIRDFDHRDDVVRAHHLVDLGDAVHGLEPVVDVDGLRGVNDDEDEGLDHAVSVSSGGARSIACVRFRQMSAATCARMHGSAPRGRLWAESVSGHSETRDLEKSGEIFAARHRANRQRLSMNERFESPAAVAGGIEPATE
jgi:hypothetical protein